MKNVVVLCALVLTWLSGCVFEERSRGDFERHNLSLLEVSRRDSSVLVFEAKAGAAYPENSATAEAKRMSWLQSWLDRQGFCPDGYEITSRSKIEFGEVNFHDMDLRYELQCVDAPIEEPAEE